MVVILHEAEDLTALSLKRKVRALLKRIHGRPTHTQLEAVAHALARSIGPNWRNLAASAVMDSSRPWMREVHAGEADGAALYLNSDPPGASDVPHEHCTWGVLIGLEGVGCNTVFEMVDICQRRVREVTHEIVAPGDIIILGADAIHALDAHGDLPFVTLNLYGSPITSRPSFEQRSYWRYS